MPAMERILSREQAILIELLAQVSELASPKHAGEEIRQSALAKAERIAQEELQNEPSEFFEWTFVFYLQEQIFAAGFVNDDRFLRGLVDVDAFVPFENETTVGKC